MELVAEYRGELEKLARKRDELLGQTVRLWGGVGKGGQEVSARLTLRLRLPHTIDMVKCFVRYPSDKMTFTGTSDGANTQANPPVADIPAPGELRLICATPSAGQIWQPGEYEVGLLNFKIADGVKSCLIDLKLSDVGVQEGGQKLVFTCLDGVLFVE
jgi:hypothetical protein